MSKALDLAGKRFGYLTVIERASGREDKKIYWKCKCKCGNETIVPTECLRRGTTQSCGCKKHETKNETHNMSKTRLYKVWCDMNQRCYREKSKDFANYGGRGIQVCDQWRHDFVAFRDWAISSGYSDNLSIDRKNVDMGYSPDNCRWATKLQQNRNKTTSVFLERNGERKTIQEWCEQFGMHYHTAYSRYFRSRKRTGLATFEDVFYDCVS